MNHSPPGPSVHGILQARILEWVAIFFSTGASWPRNWTRSPALQADALPAELHGKPIYAIHQHKSAASIHTSSPWTFLLPPISTLQVVTGYQVWTPHIIQKFPLAVCSTCDNVQASGLLFQFVPPPPFPTGYTGCSLCLPPYCCPANRSLVPSF